MLIQLDDDLHVRADEVLAVHATQDDAGEYVKVICKHHNYRLTHKKLTAREYAAEITDAVNSRAFSE